MNFIPCLDTFSMKHNYVVIVRDISIEIVGTTFFGSG